jgi:hypothetical protein
MAEGKRAYSGTDSRDDQSKTGRFLSEIPVNQAIFLGIRHGSCSFGK